jgi:hypothetical protein
MSTMMIRNKTFAAFALAIPAFALTTPAMAVAPMQTAPAYSHAGVSVHADPIFEHKRDRHEKRYKRGRGHDRHYDREYDRDYRDYDDRDYRRSNYDERISRDTRIWRGSNGQYYCQRENGTTGLLIGGVVGGLIGNEVAGRGDRTLGAIIGAAGGAILGRSIDRSNSRCR